MKPVGYTLSAVSLIALLIVYAGIDPSGSRAQDPPPRAGSEKPAESTGGAGAPGFSLAYLGCNRIDRHGRHKSRFLPSTASVDVLNAILDDILKLDPRPEILFFLGDMVLGETDTANLDRQLAGWVDLYEKKMAESGIELVAVPGNHEMLYWADYHVPRHDEWPLAGATDVWLDHMAPFMPKDRNVAPNTPGVDNRLTCSFKRGNIGFVVMNTDTYNAPTRADPHGAEGMIPTGWILDRINSILASGEVQLVSRGMDVGFPYHELPKDQAFSDRDVTILSWTANANPHNNN